MKDNNKNTMNIFKLIVRFLRGGGGDNRKRQESPAVTPYSVLASKIGEKEIKGPKHNDFIVMLLSRLAKWLGDGGDEVAWCGAAIAWAADEARYERVSGWKACRAYAWLGVGTSILEENARIGDVVVFNFSHVGLVDKIEGNYVYVLGGNQSDSINITRFSRASVSSYRRLKPLDGTAPRIPKSVNATAFNAGSTR